MPFLLIIIGIVIILISVRLKPAKEVQDPFNNVLNERIADLEIETLKNRYSDLLQRIEILEESIILIDNKVDSQGESKNTLEVDQEEIQTEPKISLKSSDNIDEVDINGLIYKLEDEGKSLDEICSELTLGKGEVLLRLGLRK